jgi:predicted nucleic acid-binding protein
LIGLVDTSVALKWYAAEPDSECAERLLTLALGAPDLILVELGNAIWKKVRLGEMTEDQARGAFPHLLASIQLLPSAPHVPAALEHAMGLTHPVYDCVFLALAEAMGLPLITADIRLIRRLNGTAFEGRAVSLREWV